MTQEVHIPIVTLIGSARFEDEFRSESARLTLKGNAVLSLGIFLTGIQRDRLTDEAKQALIEIHRKKIDMADAVHVVNPGQYIGKTTQEAIEYAERIGKPVTYMFRRD